MEQVQAKYVNLMEDIRRKVESRAWNKGDKIPSENELSREYGVSRQTVRKAISVLTNEGILYAEHGKGTFIAQKEFVNKNSKNIAVVTTYLSDYIFPRLIQGIDGVLTGEGYSILLKTTGNSRAVEARCLQELLSKEIDGMIIEPSKSQIYCKHTSLYEQLDDYGIPYVFIQGYFSQMSHKPYVLVDDRAGGYEVTKHLLEQGHKHILGVFKADDTQGEERHKGYVTALQEAGIAYNPDYVIQFHTEDRNIKPHDAVRQMIRENEKIDAVVCYNDQIAVDAIRAVEECGKRVPEDISVTGFDNSFIAKNNRIPITTISHPQEKLGMMAAELLMRLMRREELSVDEYHIRITPELIVRESTRKK